MKYIFIASVFLFANSTWACSFGPDADIFKTAEENKNNYQYVVSGTFSDKKELGAYESEYVFEVYQAHKGDINAKHVTLHSPGHSCGFFREIGGNVLWLTNDLNTIDEATPKYYFDTKQQAIEAGTKLFTKNVLPEDVPAPKAPDEPLPGQENQAPINCKSWFDGCNMCHRSVPGGPLACTRMACVTNEPTRCDAYFDESPVVTKNTPGSDIKNNLATSVTVAQPNIPPPTSNPLDGFVGPTTPPPYDNSLPPVEEEKSSLWQGIWLWITGLFPWR